MATVDRQRPPTNSRWALLNQLMKVSKVIRTENSQPIPSSIHCCQSTVWRRRRRPSVMPPAPTHSMWCSRPIAMACITRKLPGVRWIMVATVNIITTPIITCIIWWTKMVGRILHRKSIQKSQYHGRAVRSIIRCVWRLRSIIHHHRCITPIDGRRSKRDPRSVLAMKWKRHDLCRPKRWGFAQVFCPQIPHNDTRRVAMATATNIMSAASIMHSVRFCRTRAVYTPSIRPRVTSVYIHRSMDCATDRRIWM